MCVYVSLSFFLSISLSMRTYVVCCVILRFIINSITDNFILPTPPVGGLPISQHWLDRMKLVWNRTIQITLQNKNKGKFTADLATAETTFSLPLTPTWLGTEQKIMSLLKKFKMSHFRITVSNKGRSSFMYCKTLRHESESV